MDCWIVVVYWISRIEEKWKEFSCEESVFSCCSPFTRNNFKINWWSYDILVSRESGGVLRAGAAGLTHKKDKIDTWST